jgi:hypothetical protein
MFPFDEYALVREWQEGMLRQAANERLLRASQDGKGLYRTLVLWLGTHMVEWGKKLERFGEVKPVCPSSTLPDSIDV